MRGVRVAGTDEQLRSTLRLGLSTRFPVCLFWGPALKMLYNEGYTEMIGDKHPAALGAPTGWQD